MKRENGNFTDICHLQNFHFIWNDDENHFFIPAIPFRGDFFYFGTFFGASESLYANLLSGIENEILLVGSF